SIFWGTLDSLEGNNNLGRFPPLAKLDLIENGVLLFGTDIRHRLSKPTTSDLIMMGAKFALQMLATPEIMNEMMQPNLMYEKGMRHLTKIILFPVRLLYTAMTGKIGHNEEAVNYYLSHYQGAKAKLVKTAFQWRYESPKNAAAVEIIKGSLIELYIQFIDVYIEKVKEYNEMSIVKDLRNWKNRL